MIGWPGRHSAGTLFTVTRRRRQKGKIRSFAVCCQSSLPTRTLTIHSCCASQTEMDNSWRVSWLVLAKYGWLGCIFYTKQLFSSCTHTYKHRLGSRCPVNTFNSQSSLSSAEWIRNYVSLKPHGEGRLSPQCRTLAENNDIDFKKKLLRYLPYKRVWFVITSSDFSAQNNTYMNLLTSLLGSTNASLNYY